MSVPISPVVSVNTLQVAIVDLETGRVTPSWVKWFQNVTQAVNEGLTLVGTALKLPFPTTYSLGGVQSAGPVASQWISQIDAFGVPHLSQPNASDIAGIATGATTATSATAGAASALPATPEGYLVLTINGTQRKVPFYVL